MKAKPNTDQFRLKKDPSAFLEGGAADTADRTEITQPAAETPKGPAAQPVVEAKVHREQKIFRLPLDLINELKREAYERSVKTGFRVTETELVEQSLRAFLRR
ncbi:hypothetical protein [Polaromonas naphthalenivorans]|uniref:Plasmid segregation centromere-binding protein ParG n=1 Tax=Polaromonas naphthalenivorans (strain CJ2) TaxID=365044 RepID=A1VX06_POLNA|nr:hypothetical protein [Polaromonas naphthalenivorans]ABM40184.1 conserved hypothetical protein [Polaromonas naphthalenivorans CJ2]